MREPSFPFEGAFHVNVETFFIVAFPFRVVWIGFPLNLHMPFDRDGSGIHEVVFSPIDFSVEHPVVSANGREVFLLNPRFGFFWMSSFGPPSQHLVDGVIHGVKDFLAYYMVNALPSERILPSNVSICP